MPTPDAGRLYHRLRATLQPAAELSDAALLERFVEARDGAAFARLVERHGPTVHAVCRRVLTDANAADDAFQATFLVLARRAGAVRRRAAVGSWLYGTAVRVAQKARVSQVRRRRHEFASAQYADGPTDPAAAAAWRDLLAVLDEELARLPDRLRAPLVLCYLQGRTQDEAARQLGWSLGTFRRRLDTARGRLHARLVRRGVTLAAGLSATLCEGPAAAVPPELARSTAESAVAFAAGAAGSSSAVALAQAVLRPWPTPAVALVALAALAVGAGALVPDAPPVVPSPAVAARTEPLPTGAVARFGTLRLRHGGAVMGLQFTPDGRRLVSWAWDGARVWDAATGEQVALVAPRPEASPWQMQSAALSADGATLAVTYSNPRPEQLPVWDGQTGSVELWDVATARRLRWVPMRHTGRADFAPDGRTLAVSGMTADLPDRHAVALLDVATGQERLRLRGHTGPVFGVVILPGGREAITASADGTLRVWDVAAGREVRRLGPPPLPVGVPRLSPDGRILATIDRPETEGGFVIGARERQKNRFSPIRLWDVATGRELRSLPGHDGGTLYLAFAPDGRTLFSGALDGVVRVWDVDTGAELRTLPRHWCRGLALSPDGRTLATAGMRAVRLLDPATGQARVGDAGPEWDLNVLAVSPDGRTVAAGSNGDRHIHLWDTATGRPRRRLEGQHTQGVRSLVWSPDGVLRSAGGYESVAALKDGRLRAWDVATGRPLPVMGLDDTIEGFVASLDGSVLVSFVEHGTPARPSVWDAAGRRVCRLAGDVPVLPLAVTLDNRSVIGWAPGQNTAVVWDAATGQEVRRFPAGAGEQAGPAAVSRDGTRLAVGSREPFATVYDTLTGREVLRLAVAGHQRAGALAFSPDGRRLASGDSRDGTVRLWDALTGREVRSFTGHRGAVTALAFTPDGMRLISAAADTTALVWDVRD